MSDCSTNSMKPKEPPKTCGTCFYGMPRKYGHWRGNDLICLRHAVSTSSERRHVTECGWGIAGPRGWRAKEPACDACPERLPEDACKVKARCYDLGERCEKLEQVAKVLNNLCDSLMEAVSNVATEDDGAARCSAALGAVNGAGQAISYVDEVLKRLGVSVDDKQGRA